MPIPLIVNPTHGSQSPDNGGIHVPYNWVYPDEATMDAAGTPDEGNGTLTVADEGKLALNASNNNLYILVDSTVPTWQNIGDAAGGVEDTYVISASRNSSNTGSIFLYGDDGVPMNESPFRVPFASKIVAISATSRDADDWDAEIYKNTDVRIPGIPVEGNTIAEVALSTSTGEQVAGLNVAVSAGDELGLFCRGSNIAFPRINLFLVRTA